MSLLVVGFACSLVGCPDDESGNSRDLDTAQVVDDSGTTEDMGDAEADSSATEDAGDAGTTEDAGDSSATEDAGDAGATEDAGDSSAAEDADDAGATEDTGVDVADSSDSGVDLDLSPDSDDLQTEDANVDTTDDLADAGGDMSGQDAPDLPPDVKLDDGGDDAPDTGTTCGATSVTGVRLYAVSFRPAAVLVTDNLQALGNGDTATPRNLSGDNTGIDAVGAHSAAAVDECRDLLYVANGRDGDDEIRVFSNASTTSGDVTPATVIAEGGEVVTVDPVTDRLYVGTAWDGKLEIFNDASTLVGSDAPDEVINVGCYIRNLHLDRENDQLWVSACDLYIFDNASTLATGASPNRAIDTTECHAVAVDASRDRLYVGCRKIGEPSVFVFANASTLEGSLDFASARARLEFANAIDIEVEGSRLYLIGDGATSISIWDDVSSWEGLITDAPDRVINGVFGTDAVGASITLVAP